ncbi:hypothetical protein Taro_023443, partial [Colocasia esculenta]|nr:hypothetical protein [Colocasia esculenta]
MSDTPKEMSDTPKEVTQRHKQQQQRGERQGDHEGCLAKQGLAREGAPELPAACLGRRTFHSGSSCKEKGKDNVAFPGSTKGNAYYNLRSLGKRLHNNKGVHVLVEKRVWRRYHVTRRVTDQLQQEWEILVKHHASLTSSKWISCNLLRPFLLFAARPSRLQWMLHLKKIQPILSCFEILLQSINSS